MELTLETLKSAGGFVGAPVKREITWHVDGKPNTATVYVRIESFQTVTSAWENQGHGAEATAARIASCICKSDGAPLLTVADVIGDPETGHGPLSATLTIALLSAIHQANGGLDEEGTKPKKSRPKKSSGTT
ncbi:phage tail assembly chaperone family protein, TAC [Pseudomonas typographi]|uniref:Phage tail protein n=1 Tax=Pseudomonas typographi TaxID=2715964 RepID=A0ABR7Z9L3_9PSED|nr:phage tail assembly chaperone family protein, TAC [Pseudomonas typographi]MBD1590175.1 phage tail protein [Pseudomonas typographi]MBD1602255.1 phage tail protein [Pseudomonas typographi]